MAVGDITSNERFNDGKLPMDFIPSQYWHYQWKGIKGCPQHVMLALNAFESGNLDALKEWFTHDAPPNWMNDAARVFEYGAKKYAAWNWAKGMDWSVPIGCILRHTQKIIDGEELDEESGMPHTGHITCNMIMLDWFADHYPEGNNLPPASSQYQSSINHK
jgi:hypothetical protein